MRVGIQNIKQITVWIAVIVMSLGVPYLGSSYRKYFLLEDGGDAVTEARSHTEPATACESIVSGYLEQKRARYSGKQDEANSLLLAHRQKRPDISESEESHIRKVMARHSNEDLHTCRYWAAQR
jgi:hypothetical protein